VFIRNRMLVSISGLSDKKFEHAVAKASTFYLDLLLPKHLIKHITVDINFVGRLDDKATGYCEVIGHNKRNKPREFEIQIQKNKSKRYMMMTLAHEFVHLKQYAMGELDENMCVWKGRRIASSVNYWDHPWEIEAYGREYGLWARFSEKFKIRYRRTKFERDT